MEEHAFTIGASLTVLLSLIGVIWAQVNSRIKKIEDWKVDKGHCKMKEQLTREKFHGIEQRIADIRDANSSDHAELKLGVKAVQSEQVETLVELGEISKCLALLSERIPCSTDHN